jgi:hypothetical protein
VGVENFVIVGTWQKRKWGYKAQQLQDAIDLEWGKDNEASQLKPAS